MRRSELNGFRRETLEEFFWRSSNLVMMVLDDAGRVLACNEGFYHLFSVREEAAGRPIQSLLLPESRGVFDRLLERDADAHRARLGFTIKGTLSHSLECQMFVEGGRILLIGERPMPTHDDTLKQMGALNNELINQSRELTRKNRELEAARDRIKVLRGLLPVCSWCKNIRDDQGYWTQMEAYIRDHSEAEFTHSFCPDCLKKHYGDLMDDE
jgi:PAS domain-containing protein